MVVLYLCKKKLTLKLNTMKELFEAYPIMKLLPIVIYFGGLLSVLIINKDVFNLLRDVFKKKKIKH